MAFRDDGGNFSDDLFARLKALQTGSANLQDLQKQEQIPTDAINTASMVMGSVGSSPNQWGGLAQRISQAAENSGVKVVPTAEQVANEAIQAEYQNVPKNFFEKARQKASELGVGATPQEQAAMLAQKEATQNMIRQRNAQQIEQAQFNNLRKMFGK